MALIQTSLIWVTYAVAIAILLVIASTFVFLYQSPRDRAAAVTTVCILTTSCLLATVLLMPVDIALVSSTVLSSKGQKKDWATPEAVHHILHSLKIVYYTLYSADTILCLIVVPFTYFWYEEHDPDAERDGSQTVWSRCLGALKYTTAFIFLVIVLFLVGFFVPVAQNAKNDPHLDLDYFKQLLAENHGERALTFALGLLISLGTIIYILYTASGLALLPVALIKSVPSISAPLFAETTASALEQNRERQSQLQARNQGRPDGLDTRDERELDGLIEDERILVRRLRSAAEAQGQGRSRFIKAFYKIEAVLRPVKLLGGLLLMVVALFIWTSMLITGIDRAKNSICKSRCGYLLGYVNIFQPVNWILIISAKVFPVDYIVFLFFVVLLFASSVIGIATVGIRFLWLTVFKIRQGHSSPQALLMSTVMLTLIVYAINYSVTTMIAPQYSTFGTQTYCDLNARPGEMPDCANHPSLIKPCSELAVNPLAKDICTPSVVSTVINRISINFPFWGVFNFWAQFGFLGVYLVVLLTTLFKTPKLDIETLDGDLEEAEEEGLIASTGRRFNGTWQDITGRSQARTAKYGTVNSYENAQNGASSED